MPSSPSRASSSPRVRSCASRTRRPRPTVSPSPTQRRAANAQELRARLAVSRDGESLGTITPGKNRYFVEQQTSNEVAIRPDLLRAEDLFVIADEFRGDGVFLKVIVNPLVNLIWLAGFVFVLGSVVAMWPDAREARRLARRFERDDGALARA